MKDDYSGMHRAFGSQLALIEGERGGWPLCWPPRGRFPEVGCRRQVRISQRKKEQRKAEKRRCPCRLFSLAQDAVTS